MITLGMLNDTSEAALRRVFTWQARIGVAPRFGSRPIGWYQMHQCAASAAILRRCRNAGLLREGVDFERGIFAKQGELYVTTGDEPHYLANVTDIWHEADGEVRR